MPNVGLRVRKRAGKSLHTAHVLLVQVVAMRADHTLDIATSTTLSGTSIRLPSHTHGPRCVAQRATCPGRGSAIKGRCRSAAAQSVFAFYGLYNKVYRKGLRSETPVPFKRACARRNLENALVPHSDPRTRSVGEAVCCRRRAHSTNRSLPSRRPPPQQISSDAS